MKNLMLAFGTILLMMAILVNCGKETDNDSSGKEIALSKTLLGGCNGQDYTDLKGLSGESADTVIFSVENDTLDITVGINYICCAPFISAVNIANDSIVMTITDTCADPYHSCYCKCMCYYTWDFLFTPFEEKEYHYKIILNNPIETDPIVFDEGTIDLGSS